MHANQVYQDYISDRDHTHMNATQVSAKALKGTSTPTTS